MEFILSEQNVTELKKKDTRIYYNVLKQIIELLFYLVQLNPL